MKFGLTPRRVLLLLMMSATLVAAACAPKPPPPVDPPDGDPVATGSFTANSPNYYGIPVQFSSAGSIDSDGTIVSYLWDFGDGSNPVQNPEVATANPLHTFKAPGTFSYALTVTDNDAKTAVFHGTITQGEPSAPLTVLPNPVTTPMNTTKQLKVWWTGQAPMKLIFVDVCSKSIADPTFVRAFDCAPLSEILANGTASGKGVSTSDFFRGPDPSGDQQWGCFAPGDVAPPGIQKRSCFVRVTNDSGFNIDADVEVAVPLTDASS